MIEEKSLNARRGMPVLIANCLLIAAAICLFCLGIILAVNGRIALGVVITVVSFLYWCVVGPILFFGFKIIKPNEAIVLTLFGRYIGTIKTEGFYFVNPFCVSVTGGSRSDAAATEVSAIKVQTPSIRPRRLSLKTMTLVNQEQKVNDRLGNPVIISVVVVWRIINTAQAVFAVDNYREFLSIQCDGVLRNIARMYPYDIGADEDEKTLRGSSQEIANQLKTELQSKVKNAGLEIIEAHITHLSYAPEIAAVMLQRQQASAIIDARKMIVDGAVGMVEMALNRLQENGTVELDEERRASMVSNLMVVLCGNHDAQPVVNSGSLY